MIQLYITAPIKHLDLVQDFHHHMVIGPFLDRSTREWFRAKSREGDLIMLDNGCFENKVPMDTNTFLKLVRELQAKIVVMPDFWKSAKQTLKASHQFNDQLDRVSIHSFKRMGVPHGETLDEYIDAYQQLSEISDIIGLTVGEWNDEHGWFRAFMGKYALDLGCTFHLLGLWNVGELKRCLKVPRIVSIDTSIPFKLAAKNEVLKPDSFCKDDFDFEMKLTQKQQNLAKRNLQILRKLCMGKE